MSHMPSANVDPELLAELRYYRKLAASLPHDDVTMDLPEGARLKTKQGTWIVKWRGYTFIIYPENKKSFNSQVEFRSQPEKGPYANLISKTVTSVKFGAAKGVKCVTTIRELNAKNIEYELKVPGGYVGAGIHKRGMSWDESEWERLFPTIRMIKRITDTAKINPKPSAK
jgi:hypothetical protein